MADTHYEDPRLAAIYDALNPWAADTDFYLSLAPAQPARILDLGCGTGLLACAYANAGHAVVAVDPAAPMLALAREKPGS
ncbi:MAG: class I SAM-dependent methyltransferase, partial [Candidatus Competibacteraceae bacterium]|nr:class I SAM-dependent methyltransferase [Candidatus Competibacteraceae bacterium]